MARKCVLVAGATGLVGHAVVQHFAGLPDTDVVAVSRRGADCPPHVRAVPLDLTDAAACATAAATMADVTHVVFAALYEKPGSLVSGWRDAEQIDINDRMLRNLIAPLERAAKGLRHVTLLQGTKAYGVHIRPMQVPAREGRSEMREAPNFYWNQEDFLRASQRGRDWTFTIFRPVLIVGYALGGAMSLIPALGVYAALLKAAGEPLHFPGGTPRVAQAVDADLLARAIAWAGEAPTARNETFNVANGDVMVWQNVWPAVAAAVGMAPGEARPASLAREIAPRQADWERLCVRHGLAEPANDLARFVGQSFEYADFQLGYGRTTPAPPSFSSTIKLMQAGFHDCVDSEVMLAGWFREYQRRRLLPPA